MIKIKVSLMPMIEILILKTLTGLLGGLLKVGHKEILSKKADTIELTDSMVVEIHTKCPPILMKCTLTALQ